MELTAEAAHYIVRYFPHFMTKAELQAQRHLFATMKATHGRSDVGAQKEAQKSKIHSKALSHDPEVLPLAADGYGPFELRTATRILREHGAEVQLNYCPRCGSLARTPSAKQCRCCGHDWHPA